MMITEKDKKRIEEARKMHFSDWHIVGKMEDEADTEEARRILHDIRTYYFHLEDFSSDMNIYF